MDCDVDGEDDEDQHVSVDCRDDDPTDQWTSEREQVLVNDEDLVLGRVMRLLWSGWRERLCSMMIEKQSIFDGSCLFNTTLALK